MDVAAILDFFLNKLSSSSAFKFNNALTWNLHDELDKVRKSLMVIRSQTFEDNETARKMLRDILYDIDNLLDRYEIHSLESQLQNRHKKRLQVRQFFFKISSTGFRVKMVYEMHELVKRLHKIETYGNIGELRIGYGGFKSGPSAAKLRIGYGGFESGPSAAKMMVASDESLSERTEAVITEDEFSGSIDLEDASVAISLSELTEGESMDLPEVMEATKGVRMEYGYRCEWTANSVGSGLSSCALGTVKSRRRRSVPRKEDVIGRDNDKERIVESLMEWRNEGAVVSVLPIVGVGGIGKTTLVKYVYNDERIVKHFQLRIWVNVSPNFSVRKVIERIIQSASANKRVIFRNHEMDELRNMVGDILHEKVYLLVLDGMWNEDEGKWNELMDFLVAGAKGSKIVVTTRDQSAASVVGTMPVYYVKGLANKNCLSLFLKRAFKEGQEHDHPNLVRIGVDIVQKCKGITLSVVHLGSSLHKKIRQIEWQDVRDHSAWDSQQSADVLPALKVSYEKLPSYLKACLANCSIFPKGFEIEIDKMIQLWMAQGLIHTSSHFREVEDIGLEYFNELRLRSFFQDIEEDGHLSTSTCKMHDLVHDFVLSVAGSECSIVYSHTQNISEDVKHIVFSDYDMSAEKLPKSLLQNHALRTIFFPVDVVGPSSTSFVDNCVSRFMHLRTLDLSNSSFEMLPSSIGELKHLKYLDLSGNGSIRTLPSSIGKLHCLNILRVALCPQLTKLPKDIEDLISLRHLYLTTKQESLPDKRVGCLSSLRSLSLYSCKSLVSLSDELKHLSSLRSLTLVDCPKLTFLPSSMKYLTALENLYIIDCDELTLFEWQDIEGLKMLRSLVIGGLPQLGPKDVQCLENLQSLVIGGLPQLVVLPRWLEGSAHTLRNLRIERCPNLLALPEWLKNLTALEKIEISECPKLTSLPAGMPCLTELKELKIDNSPELSRECGGNDRGKIAHVRETYLDGMRVQKI